MEKAAGSNEQRPFFIYPEYVLDNQLTLDTLLFLISFKIISNESV